MSTFVIRVAGVDITDDVIYAASSFQTSVGRTPGEFKLIVRDDDKGYAFRAGQRVTLDVDGIRCFDGYSIFASQRFAFPAQDTADPAVVTRLWDIAGADINILFRKRIVFKQSDPAAQPTYFARDTQDTTFLNDLKNNLLTLGSDALTTDFHAVGTSNPDIKAPAGFIGDDWGEAMAEIAQEPGAVWGIKPSRVWYYEDDDTENAPFSLSDQPNDTTSFGYSTLEWTEDGSNLINDAQIWGYGQGLSRVVYDRVTDAPSVAAHGRWQNSGGFRGNLFRQTSVNRVAHSIVYGSPQNLHGHKDPAIVVKCRIRKAGLTPGDKVRIVSNVYDLDEVFPVRSMLITIPTKTDVLFDLVLSREIDDPASLFDLLPFPGFPGPPGGIGRTPGPCTETAASGSWGLLPGPLWETSYERGVLDPATTVEITAIGGEVDWLADVRAGDSGTIQGVSVSAVLDFFGQATDDSNDEWTVGLTLQCPTLEFGGPRDLNDPGGAGFGPTIGVFASDRFELSRVTIGAITFEARRGGDSNGSTQPALRVYSPHDYLDLSIIYGSTTYYLGTVDAPLLYDPTTGSWKPNFAGPTISLSLGVSASGGVAGWSVFATSGIGENSSFAGSAVYSAGGRPDVIYDMSIQGNATGPRSGIWSGGIRLNEILWYALPNCPDRGVETSPSSPPNAEGCETAIHVSGTVYKTASFYLSGSLTVYQNGTLQRRNVDYIEYPASSEFSFFNLPDPDIVITACYMVADSGGGGGGLKVAT